MTPLRLIPMALVISGTGLLTACYTAPSMPIMPMVMAGSLGTPPADRMAQMDIQTKTMQDGMKIMEGMSCCKEGICFSLLV